MPTYEYKCTACHHRFEQFQSMRDKSLRKCPACGKSTLERLIGMGAAVIFKGSGFYQTDYRSESYKQAADADKKVATTPATESKAPSATDTKPADVPTPAPAPTEQPAPSVRRKQPPVTKPKPRVRKRS